MNVHKICTNCNNVVAEEELFCSKCGRNLIGVTKKVEHKKNERNILHIIAIIIIALFIVWLLRNPYAQRNADTDSQIREENSDRQDLELQGLLNDISDLEKMVVDNPKDFSSLLLLAHRYHDTGQLLKSIEIYTKYLVENPTDADAHIALGVSYYKMAFKDTASQKDYFQKAILEMHNALTHSPMHQLGHFNIAIITLHSGNSFEATRWFNKTIEINPNTEIANKAREILTNYIN